MSSTPFLNFANFPFVVFKMQILIYYYLTLQTSGKTYVLHHFKGPNNSYVLMHIQHIRKSLSKQQRIHGSRLPSTCALNWHVDFLIMNDFNPSHGVLKIFIK